MLKENYDNIEAEIQKACVRAGRLREDVQLISVSKTKPLSLIEEAVKLGYEVFGENKVQELVDKYENISKPVSWHLIGHLQTNKVKYIVDKAEYIHSVDSLRLAKEIQKEAAKKNVICKILLEVNVAEETTKFGLRMDEVEDLIRQIKDFPNILICGLMTIAPFVANPEDNRVHFRALRHLLLDINSKNIDNINMNVLSMGMTNDYQVAIEEGSTMVRIGTGIFGERDYNF